MDDRAQKILLVRSIGRLAPVLAFLETSRLHNGRLLAFRTILTISAHLVGPDEQTQDALDRLRAYPIDLLDAHASYPKGEVWAYAVVEQLVACLRSEHPAEIKFEDAIRRIGMATFCHPADFDYEVLLYSRVSDDEFFTLVARSEIWSIVCALLTSEAEGLLAGRDVGLLSQRLWFDFGDWHRATDLVDLLGREGGPWTFWAEWYGRMLDGRPLPWGLQREIALIPDAIWEAGPEAVAERIEVIRTKHDMLERIAELERSLELHMSGDRHGIGGNNPPEPIDDGTFDDTATAIRERIVVVWDATEILKDEADKEVPDKFRVGQAIEMIAGAVAALAKFSAQVVAYVAHTVFQGSVAAGCAVLAADPVLLEKLLIAARSWLAVLH